MKFSKMIETSPYRRALELHQLFLPSPSNTVGSSCGQMTESRGTLSSLPLSHTMAGTPCSVVVKQPRNYESGF
jgi:hypothetical protein